QLINVADESHLWSERYDREMTDVFAVQDDISQSIANALKVKLAISGARRGNIDAYHSCLKGLHHHQRYTPEGMEKAKEFFDQALVHDPSYAPAYAGLAGYYYAFAGLNIRPMTEMAPPARAAAEKALAIDRALPDAHSVLGVVAAMFEYDWKGAEREFQMAMAAEPVLALVRFRYGLYCLIPQRRLEEAAAQFEKALETDPLSMVIHFILSYSLYLARQYDSAIERAAKALDINASFWLMHLAIGITQFQKGSIQEAIASLEKTLALAPWYSPAVGYLAAAHARAGNRAH